GYTIRGVQRLLREQGLRFVQNDWQEGAPAHRPAEEEGEIDRPEAGEGADELRAPPLAEADEGRRSESIEHAVPVAARAVALPSAGLARKDVQKLQAALRDLTECRRLLEAALADTA
ncbi:MAG: hypothetical protein WBW74_07405, partial [Xanthobacteraceae bacterium]